MIAWRRDAAYAELLQTRLRYASPGNEIDPDRFRLFLEASLSEQESVEETKRKQEWANAIVSILNQFEFIALAVRNNDFDEDVLRKGVRGNICNFFADAHLVIRDYRASNSRTFEHLTALYARWKDADQPIID